MWSGIFGIVLVAGCGRIGFDLTSSGSNVAPDDSISIFSRDGGPPPDIVIPDGYMQIAASFGERPNTTYSGVTTDTYLDSSVPATNFGTAVELFGGANPARTILLRFDLSALPTNSIVTSAELVLTTASDTDNLLASLYPVNETWNGAQATWTLRSTPVAWTNAGARPPTSRSSTEVHGYTPSTANVGAALIFDANGLALIQSWLNNPAANAGFAITGLGASFSIHASTAATANYRPGLYLSVGVPI